MVTFPPPTLLPSGCAPERPQKNLTLHTSITGNLPREFAYTGLSFLLLLPHSPERGFRRKNSYIIKLSVPFLKKKKSCNTWNKKFYHTSSKLMEWGKGNQASHSCIIQTVLSQRVHLQHTMHTRSSRKLMLQDRTVFIYCAFLRPTLTPL